MTKAYFQHTVALLDYGLDVVVFIFFPQAHESVDFLGNCWVWAPVTGCVMFPLARHKRHTAVQHKGRRGGGGRL